MTMKAHNHGSNVDEGHL